MYKMHFLICIALTLAFIADGAPTSSSRQETQQQLEHLILDLQRLLNGVRNDKNFNLPIMLRFELYMPRNVTELKHLQCLVKECEDLKEVLKLDQSNSLSNITELMSNVIVLAQKLKGPETGLNCEDDDEAVNIVDFLNKWITFCQRIFSTLT
ncbi:interleukin-2 [Pipistrellus kuhlii]|uniref:Interleukin-2 n=1 Tax=Pipistrellus kuhlii TaxID=59472 RepID=A0A7J7XAK7_PIPKU|nr:interleukin-2 [Pipistrellus kuhlii]KAF6346701.1 interleukin 2 [Pipistrellus kuhlii]